MSDKEQQENTPSVPPPAEAPVPALVAPAHEDDTKRGKESEHGHDVANDDHDSDDGGDHPNYIKTDLGEMNTIESMCPKCEQMGKTRLMITKIPHFKEIIVSSFECPHCGERNNDVTFGGVFGPKKVRYELQVRSKKDLDRQVVKSEFATVTIPELELEIPPESQKGNLNTVEGILEQTHDGLQLQQPLRKIQHPEVYEKIEVFCKKLEDYRSGDVPFTLTLDDPAGNSYIEPIHDYYHPTLDPQLTKYEKERTDVDRQLLGVAIDYNTERTQEEQQDVDEGQYSDVTQIPCDCPACRKPGHMMMHECDIPYFKQTVIMAFKCDFCGYKSNEIKTGGEINEKGLRLTLHVQSEDDLKRDVLKSETATLLVPEVHLELAPGTLGGFFSSVEGTIMQVRDQLNTLPQAAFAVGDSADENSKSMMEFVKELNDLLEMKREFTFILDDPLGNVYIQNPRAHLPPPENEDPKLESVAYTRTEEQEDELGILAMRGNEAQDHQEEMEKNEEVVGKEKGGETVTDSAASDQHEEHDEHAAKEQ
ncbi:putative zinc-finger protein ZPR1 [Leptomonas pyrrhocoris]|uniref:Putative zinc-finger protein ZPR1 n=1 Tax=Leptomonas pyrrhocoris TaxID=157538 RepID=A0A0M9FUE7_LEPPY|nr:putative zinc-finger protein ZPR1 [Leptomonas pyrrhocoris]XP_015654740.1 putative zinc-finger protein ZPR1 [Leptomonas pyrrhocoris]KPA76300.1 putative zinc-finger protein ZPR1 [Leptomonas pyrrhocoris]KPA76301.1 putative zinc-finger protein ZPR1 [Leptomonas pyrrhocoris]|eukprot:XP_015654739.1 putative zinc-finger protein ZPR1 [Leptomonas pyrrhocoris]